MSLNTNWVTAYLIRTITIKIPNTNRKLDVKSMSVIRVNPYTMVARIHAYEVQLHRLDYLVVC